MQHSFEQEVQQKLGEMKLSPSAPVWEKIELEIRPDKKRRRFFFWIFIPLLIAGAGAWWYMITSSRSIPQMPQPVSEQPLDKKTGDTSSLVTTSLIKPDVDQTIIIKKQRATVHQATSKPTEIILVKRNKTIK